MNKDPSFLKSLIREVPDFPKPGILFYDISSLLIRSDGLITAIRAMTEQINNLQFDTVAAIESRGFIFGSPIAHNLTKGLIMVRKKGKLPGKTFSTTYDLEYGEAIIEVPDIAISRVGERVLIVDDLIATGGTVSAAAKLLEGQGANIVGISTLIEIEGLKGRDKVGKLPVYSVIRY